MDRIPQYCAQPDRPHPLVEGYMINGWVECSCGGHRTVLCIAYDRGGPCHAVHYVPPLTAACSRSGIPEQRRPAD
ncbi:MAG TPA: hypothetical protein VGH99_00075 [Pseudonocardia sp.]|jgi:hypothetical protein